MRFSTIANLGNAPAIHNQNIVVKTCQSAPAAHQQPTEPTQSLCPVSACLAPIGPQSLHMVFAPPEIVRPPHQHTEHFVIQCYISKPWKKRKSVEKKFTWLRLVLKKKRFSKFANLGNAPAIDNQYIIVKIFQSPPADHQLPTEPTQSLCPVRACLAPISPQSPHMVFAPSELVSPPHQPTEHFAIQCYISKPWKKKEIGWIAFHLAASRLKKKAVFKNCKFRKRARNTQQRYRCKDMSEPTSSPQSPHRAFGPSGLV